MSASNSTLTRQLGTFAATLSDTSLPGDVVHCAKRALLDWIAAVLAGARDPAAVKLQRVIGMVTTESTASIVGTPQRTSAPYAALANGYSSHQLDFDDVYNPEHTTVHLGSCLWPVVMALGEMRTVNGATATASLVAGFETGARVGHAAGVRHYESNWQVTGTVGRLAAAAAAARMLSLDGERTTHALGIAAAQASGIREIYGSDTKALQPGKAAMDGVLAGLLAEQSFSSRDTALEGERGLLRAVSPSPDPGLLVKDLNTAWHIRDNGHKLYPGASLSHPAVDAAIAVHNDPTFHVDDIEQIEVRMLPFAADVTETRHPRSGAEAKFSSPHCVAVAISTGSLGLESFSPSTVSDYSVTSLREKIRIIPDKTLGKRGAEVSVRLKDGSVVRHVVGQNRGTPANPLSDGELETKLRHVAEPLIGAAAARKVINSCWDLNYLTRVSEILTLLTMTNEIRPEPG